MLKKNGRVFQGQDAGSYQNTWDVEFSETVVRQMGDGGDQVFNEHDAYRQYTNDWRGYSVTDRLTYKQYLMNKGNYAMVNLYATKAAKMAKAMTNAFGAELYIDGEATGNSNRLHGLESFLGDDGTSTIADLIARPSDTYAGQSTIPGTVAGSWSASLATPPNATMATDWPFGKGSTEYDYNSPKLVNYVSNGWNAGGTSWEETCERVLRQTLIWCSTTGGEEGRPTMFMLASDLFGGFQNYQSARSRIILPHKEAEDLGFSGTLNFEGVMLHYEYDCPVSVGYGINIYEMELRSLDSVLFKPQGPEWDMKTKSFLYEIGFYGNCRYYPKHFARLADYSNG
jgi:hypothetical protein